jgi:NNP family nitrate/nitrite transporter-like MFS transporter
VGGYLGGVIPGGWRFIPALYALLLVAMALAILVLSPRPDRQPGKGRPLRDTLAPLRHMRVWRFSLYYVVVFGAYVALSAWLPKFYVDAYGVSLSSAALLAATFIIPASLLRPVGGYLADRWGPRGVTYAVFIIMTVTLFVLSMPSGTFVADLQPGLHRAPLTFSFRLGLAPFATLMFVLGCAMGIGKASVYKYIPDYFPNDVGAVGGVVGMLGALGGFFLPPAFGALGRWGGMPQLAFLPLLALTSWSLLWLHVVVVRLRAERPLLDADGRLPAQYTATSPL